MDALILPTVLSLSFGGIIGIISQIQHSKCISINCWGIKCIRKLDKEDEEDNPNIKLSNIETPQE